MGEIKNNSKRVGLLDELRGFAIICMVVYHAMYDLKYIFGVDIPIFFESWFYVIRDIFSGLFIFISGTVCRFSRNNVKRGAQCFFLGMIITFVTPFFSSLPIQFGILHFLGISMMLFGLTEKILDYIPALVGIIVFALLFAITWNIPMGFIGIKGLFEIHLPAKAFEVGVLFPFGLHNASFVSSDYFPLFPWFFLFLAGSCFGIWAKEGSLPKFFYPTHIKWIAAVGRNTIWVYILHQPVVYLIFSLIFR